MNCYFIDLQYFNSEHLDLLIQILKVNKIIKLNEQSDIDKDILERYAPYIIYDRKSENLETSVKKAVYRFNTPLCTPIYDKGTLTGKFEIHDICNDSNHLNPIYNLENREDDNILILYTIRKGYDVTIQFVRYALNILKKYAGNINFEDRICFCTINPFFNNAWLCSRGRFYACKVTNHNAANESTHYNPILSYLNLKIREQATNFDGKDLSIFLLNAEGKKYLEKYYQRTFDRQYKITHYPDDDYMYDDPASDRKDIEDKLKHIAAEGGDWIFD